jgi:dolichol kinase
LIQHADDLPHRGLEALSGGVKALDMPQSAGAAPVAGQLDRRELRRRLWHMAPALPVPLLWLVPHQIPFSLDLQAIILAAAVLLTLHICLRYHLIRRTQDDSHVAPVLGYAFSVLGMLLAAPDLPQLGLSVLAVLAFGDGMATFAGKLFGGPRLPWNREKSWSGLTAFVLVGATAATLYYWGETQFNPENPHYRQIPFQAALGCGVVMTVVAAIAESLPSRLNDNIRVGVAAAAGVTVAHGWFVGW